MSRSRKLLRRLPLLLALTLAATTAYAQGMYRSVMPDGKIVYGDKPAPGAKESKQVNLAPLNISTPTQGGGANAGAGAPADAPPPPGANASQIATARQNLAAAQKALADGREPQEGERIGIARTGGGTSRLTDAYFQRIKALEDAVATAQAELEAASAR